MKKGLLFLICGCIILLFCRCPFSRWGWYCENNTANDTLGVYLAWGFYSAYPDTVLPSTAPSPLWVLFPGEKTLVYISSGGYEEIIKDLPKDTLSVFFFNEDTLKAYNWQIIRSDYKILVRYDLSFNDLKILNWTIPYPPTEAMRNMKMYPPYGNE